MSNPNINFLIGHLAKSDPHLYNALLGLQAAIQFIPDLSTLVIYPDNASAILGGLKEGNFYTDGNGNIKVVYLP